MAVSRGIRLNNPTNIEKSSIPWQGLAEVQDDPTFATFKSPLWGIRAAAVNLITYYDEHGCDTVDKVIRRWSKTDQDAYVANVAKACAVGAFDTISLHEYTIMRPMIEAMIKQENGAQPYSSAQIDEALKMAGVVPAPDKSTAMAMAKDPKVIAATIATTLATAQGAVSSAASIWDTLNQYIDPRYLVWACVAGILSLGIYYAIDRLKARHEGRA